MVSKVPVIIVTGYAASGKTHLVNRLLEVHASAVGVIAHRQAEEFGIVPHPVGAAAFSGEVYDFGSGCICCSPRGDMTRLLLELSQRSDLQLSLLLIKTGHAEPGRYLDRIDTVDIV